MTSAPPTTTGGCEASLGFAIQLSEASLFAPLQVVGSSEARSGFIRGDLPASAWS